MIPFYNDPENMEISLSTFKVPKKKKKGRGKKCVVLVMIESHKTVKIAMHLQVKLSDGIVCEEILRSFHKHAERID